MDFFLACGAFCAGFRRNANSHFVFHRQFFMDIANWSGLILFS